MKHFKSLFFVLASALLLCSSMPPREYPKLKVADGYVQIHNIRESSIYLEVTVYNASTEYVSGIVTVFRPENLSSNQKVVKIAMERRKRLRFPKRTGTK